MMFNDIIDICMQMGLDVFAMMREQLGDDV
jgi:hypothetical protein